MSFPCEFRASETPWSILRVGAYKLASSKRVAQPCRSFDASSERFAFPRREDHADHVNVKLYARFVPRKKRSAQGREGEIIPILGGAVRRKGDKFPEYPRPFLEMNRERDRGFRGRGRANRSGTSYAIRKLSRKQGRFVPSRPRRNLRTWMPLGQVHTACTYVQAVQCVPDQITRDESVACSVTSDAISGAIAKRAADSPDFRLVKLDSFREAEYASFREIEACSFCWTVDV